MSQIAKYIYTFLYMGRNIHGTNLQWDELVMGRNIPGLNNLRLVQEC